MRQKGREWRSLSDTAVSGYLSRGGSPHWSPLRRGQDYYDEGLLFWLEVDAIIRRETDGRKNLDDFCAEFFGRSESDSDVVPYDGQDVLDALNAVLPHEWENLVEERINRPMENLSLDFVGLSGYRLAYDSEPSEFQKEHQKDGKYIAASDSLGLDFQEDGGISYIVPDTIADNAGLAPEMKVIGVNGRKFSRQRIEDALADSVAKRKVELLVLEGDCIRTIALDYADGPKYLKLVQDSNTRDLLSDILSPRTYEKEEEEE
jgi:predicted metalloprotease with PDZ domain